MKSMTDHCLQFLYVNRRTLGGDGMGHGDEINYGGDSLASYLGHRCSLMN